MVVKVLFCRNNADDNGSSGISIATDKSPDFVNALPNDAGLKRYGAPGRFCNSAVDAEDGAM